MMSKQDELCLIAQPKLIVRVGRRAMLECAVDAALGASLVGALAGNVAAAPQQKAPTPAATGPGIRRIVTGHNAKGKSYVVSDTVVTGSQLYATGDNPLGTGNPGDPMEHMASTMTRLDPPTVGASASTHVYMPPWQADMKPVWHRTMTLDYNFLISGEMVLMLEEGEVTLTNPGDVVVQRNTNHAWRNGSSTKPLIWVAVLVRISDKA
jgi:hypothetical protein